MPDPTQDRLSPEDAQALIHAQQHLFSINDPRAAKVYNYIVQNGYAKTGPQGELLPMDEMGPKPSWGQQALSMVTHPLNSLESAAQPVSRPAGASVPEMVDADAANVGAGAASVVRHPINTAANALATVGGLVTAPLELAQGKPTIYGQTADAVRNANPQTGAFALGQAAATAGVGEGLPLAADAAEAFPWRPDMTAPAVGPMVRRAIAGDVNAPMPGTDLTPAARYQSMKGVGIQPNAAEATNSTPLNIAEKVNQNSLFASPTYVKARATNLRALGRFTDEKLNNLSSQSGEVGGAAVQQALLQREATFLNQDNALAGRVLDHMSPLEPEAGGAAVQQGLRDAQTKLQNGAAEGFSTLDRAVGNRKMQGRTIQQTAQNIYDANKDYYAQHPALVPTTAWKMVKDLAGAENDPPFSSRPMGFPEVHQLRSDLLELVRTNPDIVKNQAGGWLQQLANAADQTMTTGATGLNAQGTQIFRDANEAWANMKGTYDNPSHPFYNAVRTPSPSTLVNGIQQTPEIAKLLQTALGPEGIGPIQRGVAEKLLGTTKEGGYDFKNFQGNWNRMPQAYREALFAPEQISQFEQLATRTAANPFYDPQSVLYKAARAQDPSTLVRGVVQTPEAVKELRDALGPQAMGPIQRGVAESLLRSTKEGQYNFKTFQGQWNKLKPDYRDALFTPEQQQHFADIGNAGTVLHEDLNPSGTAKLGQGQAEMFEGGGAAGSALLGHPAAAIGTGVYHAIQFALAKLMNSSKFVDWLMKDQGVQPPAGGAVRPVSAAAVDAAPAATTGPRDYTDAELGLIPGIPYGPAFRESRVRYKGWQDEAARARGEKK